MLKHILRFVGYEDGDGIFSPGGSMSNMYGMVLARYRFMPKTKTKGISQLPPFAVFVSEESHYSIMKGAHWLGIGTDNVIKVSTDSAGRMIPDELSRSIDMIVAEGKIPFLVVATAGSTVLGAFDPLDQLADICVLGWISDVIKKVFAYLKRFEQGLLHQCNSASATYLFQQDKFYDISYDTGDKSIQCGRKVDAFKLWLMWKARGDIGLERLVDNTMECARYLRDQIVNRPGFRMVVPEVQCTNVCFWYIPPALWGEEESEEWWNKVHTVAPKIKERLVRSGTLMIGYQPLAHKNLKNFFRAVSACHPPPTTADMDHTLIEIERHGKDLFT
uniref:Glutamate decarboxylase n=1 Tax=Timema poppense TaxID=170557 RepID=A0A7R9DB04_TIMPO|nr:unnamed protein product [Timema poppensis]